MKKKNSTAEQLAKNVGVAALGAFSGAFIGKFGVPASILTMGYGIWKDQPLAVTAGAAMMTGGAVAGVRVQSGIARVADQSFVDAGKENINGFVKGLAQGLWLDQIPAVKEKLDLGSIPSSMLVPETDPAVMAELQAQAQAMEGISVDQIEGLPSGYDQI